MLTLVYKVKQSVLVSLISTDVHYEDESTEVSAILSYLERFIDFRTTDIIISNICIYIYIRQFVKYIVTGLVAINKEIEVVDSTCHTLLVFVVQCYCKL